MHTGEFILTKRIDDGKMNLSRTETQIYIKSRWHLQQIWWRYYMVHVTNEKLNNYSYLMTVKVIW